MISLSRAAPVCSVSAIKRSSSGLRITSRHRRAGGDLVERKQFPERSVHEKNMAVCIDDEQAILHRTQNGLGFGDTADQLLSELPVTIEKFLERKSRPARFRASTDKKGGGLFSLHDLLDQLLKFAPRRDPLSPNDQSEQDYDRRSRR